MSDRIKPTGGGTCILAKSIAWTAVGIVARVPKHKHNYRYK